MDDMPPSGMDSPQGTDTMPPPQDDKPEVPTLSADMLPPGAKAGDKLVLGQPDEQGMFPVTLEPAMGKSSKGGDDEDMAQWKDDFRKHMSPMMGDET